MPELSGFNPVAKLGADLGPQSVRVPANKEAGVAQAAALFEALWDAVDGGLSPNVQIEILKHASVTYCRISPLKPDGVERTIANPGDWIAVDGFSLAGMSNKAYANRFTDGNLPIEWAYLTEPPLAELTDDNKAKLTFLQPTSANRPFTYTVKLAGGQEVPITGAPVVFPVDAHDLSTEWTVTILLDIVALGPGESAGPFVVHVATNYEGIYADSAPTAVVTRPAPEAPQP